MDSFPPPGRPDARPQDPTPGPGRVAAVLVASGLAHLDHEFEYAIAPELAGSVAPGVRVKVRFAGRDVDGFVVDVRQVAEHAGQLAPLRRVVSPEPVLTPPLLALARAVAAHQGGTVSDVLRLAIPTRHARAERALTERYRAAGGDAGRPGGDPAPPGAGARIGPDPPGAGSRVDPGPWLAYPAGEALLRRIATGQSPAASWLAAPGQPPELDWPRAFAIAAHTALAAGRGALLVVPDHRDVARLDAALTAELGPGRHVRLTADQGPQARYTAWLSLLRGHVRCVVGTRAAAFAPVPDLGLVAWWDDGDDLFAEPRAPYPHVRDVLALRARLSPAAALVGGFTRTVEVAQWVREGLFRDVGVPTPRSSAGRASAERTHGGRERLPVRVTVAGEGFDDERDGPAAHAHLPGAAWRAAKAALADGPVLVQVPRRGYLPSLACAQCRWPARCPHCHGPLGLADRAGALVCQWCGRDVRRDAFRCPHCDGEQLRSTVVGAQRTAEELGRAFPGIPVVAAEAGGAASPAVADRPTLVVATPGAEPVPAAGYRAALLLDAWALLDLPTIDAPVEALRRWCAAAALVRGGDGGPGQVVLCGVPPGRALPAVESLVRWDPAWLADRELDERAALSLPPSTRMAALRGTRPAIRRALELLDQLPAGETMERIGPVPVDDDRWRVLLRVRRGDERHLTGAVAGLRAAWSAHKEREPLTVRIDPDLRG